MDLVRVEENALTVELSWTDCAFLAHVVREALSRDSLHAVADWGLAEGYARALIALFEAGGMASWAHTVEQRGYTLEAFRVAVPVTTQQRAAWEAQVAAAQAARQAVPLAAATVNAGGSPCAS